MAHTQHSVLLLLSLLILAPRADAGTIAIQDGHYEGMWTNITFLGSMGPATIDVAGGTSLSANTTLPLGADLPPSQTAVFIYGHTPAQVPFGDGFLCLSLPAGVVRLWPPTTINGAGQASRQLDYTQLPAQGQITNGSTWNFQLYYRDPAAGMSGFNLTAGVEVTFAP